MDFGIVTRSFPEMGNRQTAEFMAANGFTVTELCLVQTDSPYWIYNGRSDLDGMDGVRLRQIADLYRDAGVKVHSLGIFTNLIAEDEDEREACLVYGERMIELAAEAGIGTVASECGFNGNRRGLIAETFELTYQRLLDSLSRLCQAAERRAVDFALEPCIIDIVPSAKRTVDTIRQVGSPRLKVLLDPANLIANNSEVEMFSWLAPHISYMHGKDRKINDRSGRNIGEGDIDWPLFLSTAHRVAEDKPLIIEYPRANNAAEILRRLQTYDRQAVARTAGQA